MTQAEMQAAVEIMKQFGPDGENSIEPAVRAMQAAGLDLGDQLEQALNEDRLFNERVPRPHAAPADSAMEHAAHITGVDRQNRVEDQLSPLTLTPQSSNVYSFQYHYPSKTLYVTYKAPIINQSAVSNYRGSGGQTSMAGDLGRTIQGKTNAPGVLYAYFKVPVAIYKKLKEASSKGKAVWDHLRIRGTVWGHEFRYRVVAAVEVGGENGKRAYYVPRNATKDGFKSRAVAVSGSGRRAFANATLPSQRGHNTRPNRGRPNRGRPNRGR